MPLIFFPRVVRKKEPPHHDCQYRKAGGPGPDGGYDSAASSTDTAAAAVFYSLVRDEYKRSRKYGNDFWSAIKSHTSMMYLTSLIVIFVYWTWGLSFMYSSESPSLKVSLAERFSTDRNSSCNEILWVVRVIVDTVLTRMTSIVTVLNNDETGILLRNQQWSNIGLIQRK